MCYTYHIPLQSGSHSPGDVVAATEATLQMAILTLRAMAAGGVYDHIGGGFHRYSVDEFWHVPHFEKMLYDNPQLARTYLDAFALTGDARLAWVARGVLDYLRRDLRDSSGGFFSAEVRHVGGCIDFARE